ncbi:caspase family protein [Dactylosporangium aurantiacum]|uniref:Caspase family protein n=1 Tax=Dactylosporangium aurantiacum TaxID=35754 RepID=A0A9Q9IP23_9ACTN|nr:caspase family protein [Dactylosporangium aurantiacum]MDG6108259.1 caspase family protein [Dactylosporangium aurantiacum]UWZ58548.1 caspase family protein [Dactylosporangium aurantiacum]
MRLPEHERSRAVLVGVGHYHSSRLADLASAVTNVRDLRDVLTSASLSTFSAETCEVIEDPQSTNDVLAPIKRAASEARDLLLVYFAGHGLLLGDSGELHLATGEASDDEQWRSVPYRYLAELLGGCEAATKIVILDCCYSGWALKLPIAVPGGLGVEGTYVITSSSWTRRSLAPEGMRNTAFTGQLLELMRDGLEGAGDLLPMRTLFNHVRKRLADAGYPAPQQLDGNTAGAMALVRNVHPYATGRPSTELRAAVREEIPAALRSSLDDIRQAVAAQSALRVLGRSAEEDLWAALAAVPPMEPAVLHAIWERALAPMTVRPSTAGFTTLAQLVQAAGELAHAGDPAHHPLFRCVAEILARCPTRAAASALATWADRHRPGPSVPGPRLTEDRRPVDAAVVILLSPAATPERRGKRYHAAIWLYTDTDGFTAWYPDPARYPHAGQMTVKDAQAGLGTVLYDALDRLARTAGDTQPVIEFVLPQELWDLDVEEWRIGPQRSKIGLQYPTVVRSLERLRQVESHQRWQQQWAAAATQLGDRGRPRITCRSCNAAMNTLAFQDFLHRTDQHGAVVLLERHGRGGRNRESLRAGLAAGVPGFLLLRPGASVVAEACRGDRFHRKIAESFAAGTAAELPHLTLRLRRSARPPFDQGFVLLWDDPGRRPHLEAPLVAPAARPLI